MRKIFFLLFFIAFTSNINSQEILVEKEIKLRSFFLSKNKKDVFPVVNKERTEIQMFLLDNKEIRGLTFNMDYILKDSFTTFRPKGKFNILLGNTYHDKNYTLFFTNENKTKFSVKSINIINKQSKFKELDLKLKGEEFLESISYNNKLYIITIKRKSSKLYIYEFVDDQTGVKKEIDLSKERFSKSFKTLFYVLFHTNSALKEKIVLNKIDHKNPNSIDLVSFPNKIYCYNNTIYITMDVYDEYTKVISIDLTNFKSNVIDYPFAEVDCAYDLGIRSNSYLFENNIYQISGCKKELYFSIADIKNGSKYKEWRYKKDDAIDLKNTPLIQLGGAFHKNENYKELDETKQILKKIEDGNIGISVYKPKEDIEVTIGGYAKLFTKELIGVALMGFAAGVGGTPNIGPSNNNYYSNPTMYSFQNYAHARSVYFKSLFNQNLDHIKGNVSDNAFDKIRIFANENANNFSVVTIFKVSNYYVLGYYDKTKKKYYLLKFID